MQREYLESWPENNWSPRQIQGPLSLAWEYLYPCRIAVVEAHSVACERMNLYND